MTRFSMTRRIEAPIETVFEMATDLPRAAQHIRGIERIELLTDLPIGVGTRWRETRRVMGHEDTQTMEITAFDPPRSYTIGCDSYGSHFGSTFRFAAQPGGTDVTLEVQCEARSLGAKLMSPLGNLMFGSVMRKCMEDDLDDLKRVAEMRVQAS